MTWSRNQDSAAIWRARGRSHRSAAPFDDGDLLMDYLDRLARCAAELRLDALPASTVTAAKLVLLDTLGAIVAGSRLPENTRLARLAATRVPHGMATLLGHGARSDAFWAALTNATAGV